MASIFSDGNLNSFYNKTREKRGRTIVSFYHSFRIIARDEREIKGEVMEDIHILRIYLIKSALLG